MHRCNIKENIWLGLTSTIARWCQLQQFGSGFTFVEVVLVHNKRFSRPVFKFNIYCLLSKSVSDILSIQAVRFCIGFLRNLWLSEEQETFFSLSSCFIVFGEVLDVWFIGSSDQSVGFWVLLSTAGVCNLWPACHCWRVKGRLWYKMYLIYFSFFCIN